MTIANKESTPAQASHGVPFGAAVRVWCKVALMSFGGPAGQIAVMHRILVEEKRWISENRFLHALNYCMLLPGPEAQQLATYIGWLLHRSLGGLVAGTLFILPGFVSILALSVLYAGYQEMTLVQGLFYGLKPAVVAIVVSAVFRIGRRALKNRVMISVAALSFAAIFFFQIPFPLIVFAALASGYLGGRWRPDLFVVIQGHAAPSDRNSAGPALSDHAAVAVRPTWGRALRVSALWLTLWFAPIALLQLWLPGDHTLVTEARFFSKTAVVTFGGAYGVLAYIAQQAVETFGWLQPGEMLDGLGMAETTPGPLIQVVQFVGFMGAYRNPGTLSPMAAAVLGSIVTTWVTFVPCFLWIFLGAPYVEQLRGRQSLNAALSAITAAVVGVILNLSIWFALHTLFAEVRENYFGPLRLLTPDWNTLDPFAAGLTLAAFVAMFRYRQGMHRVLAASTLAGLAYFWLIVV